MKERNKKMTALAIIVCIVSFIFGAITGVIISLFMVSIGETNKKHDFYQEGFINGYNKGKEE